MRIYYQNLHYLLKLILKVPFFLCLYFCLQLFKNVAERGKWSELLMDAHSTYKDHNIHSALMQYSFAAELGYEVAQSNVAYILDKGKCF